jgi:uncharacterized membrane protein
MTKKKLSWFKRTTLNIRNRLVSGIFVIVPFVVTVLVIKWLFGILEGILAPFVTKATALLTAHSLIAEVEKNFAENVLYFFTFFCLIALIYIIGVIAKFVAGRRLLAVGENIVLKIPLARTIYTATKQVTSAISIQENKSFTSVALVEFPRKGLYAVGFLTGTIQDSSGTTYCKVFIPTTPNPTTGFFELVPINDVIQTEMTIEEAFKIIISGGIVAPEILKTTGSFKQITNASQ